MLKTKSDQIDLLEKAYPGIKDTILRFENANLPPCPHCGAEDTAVVQVGIVGRTIHICAMTTKFKLIPNGPKPGGYFCNTCRRFYDNQIL